MKNKAPLYHLLIVAIIAILSCNVLTLGILQVFSGGYFWNNVPIKYVMVIITVFYGMYLHFFRNKRPANYLIIMGAMLAGILFVEMLPQMNLFIWLIGAGINFSVMRILILQRSSAEFFLDFSTVLIGLMVSLFISPLSLLLAAMGFLTVQVLYETRSRRFRKEVSKDRFYESLKTAERVLGER